MIFPPTPTFAISREQVRAELQATEARGSKVEEDPKGFLIKISGQEPLALCETQPDVWRIGANESLNSRSSINPIDGIEDLRKILSNWFNQC